MFNSDFANVLLAMFIRPFSSSSSLALMLDSFSVSGVDSASSIVLSLIYCCCDASMYVLVLYYSYLDMSVSKIVKYGFLINVLSYIFIILFVIVIL